MWCNFFHFHAVLGNLGQIIGWRSNLWGWRPLLLEILDLSLEWPISDRLKRSSGAQVISLCWDFLFRFWMVPLLRFKFRVFFGSSPVLRLLNYIEVNARITECTGEGKPQIQRLLAIPSNRTIRVSVAPQKRTSVLQKNLKNRKK